MIGRVSETDAPPVKATDLLTATLRDRIGPELRASGLRGSGQNWSLPHTAKDYALLSFQRSTYSDATEARFTVNLRVTRRLEWEAAVARSPWLGTRPKATSHGGPGWQERIGSLLDPGIDRWWVLRTPDDVPGVVDDVLHLVHAVALPHLTTRLADGTPPPPYPWPPLPDGA